MNVAVRIVTLVAVLTVSGARAAGEDGLTALGPGRSPLMLTQPASSIEVGMSMIGGSISDGGDDVGPANEVQDMIERDHPVVTFSGTVRTTWSAAQPGGPNDPYDWSHLDAQAPSLIPGKALTSYYQMWGTSPGWADLWANPYDSFLWQKFEEFVEAMTVHINDNYGLVYYVFENEPNISRAPDGWSWDAWYMHCLPHFYDAAHAANTQTGMDNTVIAGNLCGHTAGGFNDLYARGLKDCSDILGYHAYPSHITDGVEVADLALIHSIQVTYGDAQKQLYVSEGWGSGRSAGFDRSHPKIEPPALEVENMHLAMVKGWDNVMTEGIKSNGHYWHPDYLWGMRFFCGNDNWGAMNWRSRATPYDDDSDGNIDGFWVDGYKMGLDVAPYFWNGGMMDWYGNSKDCLAHVFPGDGLCFMNPGFELPSDPPNAHLPLFWSTEADPAPISEYTLDGNVFRNGACSMALTQTVAESNGISQLTARGSVTAGTSYRARVWCQTQDAGGLAARFYMAFYDLNGTIIGSKIWAPDVTGTNEWQQMEVIATAPEDEDPEKDDRSRVGVGCYISGIGTAWFDDVTISETSQTETGTVRGYTFDEGQIPVPDAIVSATTGSLQAVSDADGFYEIEDVPTGTYDFVCRKAGYVPHLVKNQTAAAERITFVSFNMGVPQSGLTVTQIDTERGWIMPTGDSIGVTVTVSNTSPYPNLVSQVGLFIEKDGNDVTNRFTVIADPTNPDIINDGNTAPFDFAITLNDGLWGESFQVNAYAFGQEDRPDMLFNGGFDDTPWYDPDDEWTFEGALWEEETGDYCSPPRSVRCYINDTGYTWWNWALNHSANASWSPPSYPGASYTVGVYHKDNLTGNVPVKLFIEEFYYDGDDWFRNGRRWAAVPHRTAWGHDVMIYETGDPAVTPGLYSTNRLKVGCGPQTEPPGGSGYNWWDDLYLKETGDWLADDGSDSPATITVSAIEVLPGLITAAGRPMEDLEDDLFTVRHAAPGTLVYVITDDVGWLDTEPDQGTSSGEIDTITVHYDTTGLTAGIHNGTITVSDVSEVYGPQMVAVELTLTSIQPDFDGDGDVDQEDFGHLQVCLSGSGVVQSDPDCADANFDGDDDVDHDDFAVLQGCLSGANVPADPDCAG